MSPSRSLRRRSAVFFALLVLPLAVVGSFARAAATYTFTAAADSYVQSDQPATNFGSSKGLRVDNSPITTSYLRFTVSGTSGTVTNATLRVFATSTHSVGYDVYKVTGTPPTFTETGLTYSNAPALAATKTGSSGPTTANSWTSVNVTSLVTGTGAGTYEIGLKTTQLDGACALESRGWGERSAIGGDDDGDDLAADEHRQAGDLGHPPGRADAHDQQRQLDRFA